MCLYSSSKWEREVPSSGVTKQVRGRLWDNLPSVIKGWERIQNPP
jgi:hypothetical protein